MSEEQKAGIQCLINAASMALGYVVAKEGESEPLAKFLAQGLEACGAKSVYTESILREACRVPPPPDSPF